MRSEKNDSYKNLLVEVREKIRAAQHEALKAVNKNLIRLYWDIGKTIVSRQKQNNWGKSVVKRLSEDLQKEYPGIKGFSAFNLWRMRKFYLNYCQNEKLAPLVQEIGWTHNIVIMEKIKDDLEREFYIRIAIKFGWTKNVLVHQMENQSYQKYLANQTNFDSALPDRYRKQAKLAGKDEYIFDFLELSEEHSERELEIAIIRNTMTKDFIQKLEQIGFDLTPEEIADILWLAQRIDKPAAKEMMQAEEPRDQSVFSKWPEKMRPRPEKMRPRPEIKKVVVEESQADLYHPGQGGAGGLPLRTPGGSGLPGQLAMGRALRPLMRKVPSRTRLVLDEEATVQRIADEDNWFPVYRPARSRWLDLVIVADGWSSMVIWEETIFDLKHMLERQGAFRNVRLWSFSTDGEKEPFLHEGAGHGAVGNPSRKARELVDPSRERMVLIVSDCVSPAWYDGRVSRMMMNWTGSNMTAIVQILPYRLWSRTGLGRASSVYLRSLAPGTVNEKLEAKSASRRMRRKPPKVPAGLKIPVITLEPRSLHPYAKSVAATGGLWIPGIVMNLGRRHPPRPPQGGNGQRRGDVSSKSPFEGGAGDVSDSSGSPDNTPKGLHKTAQGQRSATLGYLGYQADVPDPRRKPPPDLSLEKRMQIFRATVSPLARRLAGYFAAAPLSLPVMRLIQRVMLPESRQVHLAEVFLSGLIRRTTPRDDPAIHPDSIQYEFVEGVREMLLGNNLLSESVLVLETLSEFIGKNMGKPLDFQAMIADPSLVDEVLGQGNSQPFAKVASSVLRRLGGKYTEMAERLDTSATDTPLRPPQGGISESQSGVEGDVSVTDTPLRPPQGGISESQSPPLKDGDVSSKSPFEGGAGDVSSKFPFEGGAGDVSSKSPLEGGAGGVSGDVFTNKLDMKFVLILPGEFLMGSPEDEPGRDDNENQHWVKISKAFYMQTTQVTQGQWEKLMGVNPSHFKDGGEDCPVEQVSWDDAQRFIKKLNETGETDKYRLPTEAEWEYACRAGTTTPFHFGECLSTDEANYNGNYPLGDCPKGEYRNKTVPVRSFPPNDWELYDMHGNVWEWCQDWYGDYYPSETVTDPGGPSTGSERVLRGGSWINDARFCRAAVRDGITPVSRDGDFGFRLVRLPGQQGR